MSSCQLWNPPPPQQYIKDDNFCGKEERGRQSRKSFTSSEPLPLQESQIPKIFRVSYVNLFSGLCSERACEKISEDEEGEILDITG